MELEGFEEVWRGKSDAELQEAAAHIEDYTSEGQHAIRSELARRGMDSSPLEQQIPQEASEQFEGPIYFPISTTKLTLLCITTFGLYELYWFYKHWSFEKARTRERISPFWRTSLPRSSHSPYSGGFPRFQERTPLNIFVISVTRTPLLPRERSSH